MSEEEANINYYYINTEANAFNGRSPHNKWIERRHAFTSGDYEKGSCKKKVQNAK